MIQPILYQHIEDKNRFERSLSKALSPEESLVMALDMIDLFIQFRNASAEQAKEKDAINWIILPLRNDY